MNNDLKQDFYEEPEIEIVTFGKADILSVSGPDSGDNPNQLPVG